MKKIFIIIGLFLSVNLYANNIELTVLEKQNLLEWTSENCGENHKNYESLSKDRYFICKKNKQSNVKNHPRGLQGTLTFYEEGIDKRTIKEIAFFGILYFLAILLLGVIILTKHTNNKFGSILRSSSIVRLSSVLISGFIILGGLYIYEFLEDFSTNTLRNGNIEAIEIALPIYNMLNLDEPPLILTVSSGSIDAVKYLIEEKKYNPNQSSKDWYGNTTNPFHLALSQRSYEIADYLKQYLPVDKPVAIATASKSFDIELLKKSVKLDKPTPEKLLDGFLTSIEYSDYKAMEYLYSLDHTLIKKEGKRRFLNKATPLNVAIQNNNFKAVKFLFSKGVVINKCGVLSSVAYKDNVKIFNFLLDNGADINLECKDNDIALSIARGKAKKMEELFIEKGWGSFKKFKKMKDNIYYGI